MQTTTYRFSLVLLFLFSSALVTLGQTPTSASQEKTLNYGFVSPNTKEGLTVGDAIKGMNSNDEWNLIRQARRLRCVIKTEISVSRALGSWSDGAENSTILRLTANEPTVRYVMSRLGSDARQKAVLYFHSQSNGAARLYILRPNKTRDLRSIISSLDRSEITFRTLVPTRTTTIVYLVDTDNNLRTKVNRAAKLLRAQLSSLSGTAEFIGDDKERDRAASIYAGEIKNYEANNPKLPPLCGGK